MRTMIRAAMTPRRLGPIALIGVALAASGGWRARPTTISAPATLRADRMTTHRVVFLVGSDDVKVMKHAISWAFNATRYYGSKGEAVTIEIVATGAGIKMFRADVSPLQDILTMLRKTAPGIVFSVCAASTTIAEQNEGHPISFIEGATPVPYGIGRVIDLQESGWAYVHA